MRIDPSTSNARRRLVQSSSGSAQPDTFTDVDVVDDAERQLPRSLRIAGVTVRHLHERAIRPSHIPNDPQWYELFGSGEQPHQLAGDR